MAIKERNNQAHPIRPQAAYLIRCWLEDAAWRYAIEDVASRRRRRFDSLAALLKGVEMQLLTVMAEESPNE